MDARGEYLAEALGNLRLAAIHYPTPNGVWEWIETATDAAQSAVCETKEDRDDFDRIFELASMSMF